MTKSRFTVGEKVALTENLSDIPAPRVVASVSPAGRVRLIGSEEIYNPDGQLRGRARWDSTGIEPWHDYHDARRRDAIVTRMRAQIAVGLLARATSDELTEGLRTALAERKEMQT